MKFEAGKYDAVVVGAGHAGCEAALACARKGKKTLLLTMHLDAVAMMPCNPSIGGTGKGHLVREIDALGGQMGKVIDKTYLQIKTLNTSKGAAVHSLRAQADKARYHDEMKRVIERQENLYLKQEQAVDILTDETGAVVGVETYTGGIYRCRAVVLASGTYLKGRVIIGEALTDSGPNGLTAAHKLSSNLEKLGFTVVRLKTGTPARINKRSIDFSKLIPQYGDKESEAFSFDDDLGDNKKDLPCYLAYTNERTHEVIRANLSRSPLYSGVIEGTGPRYCPSIEDKIVRFADKKRHQLFVEPEGESTDEVYLQGLSSSLPEDIQEKFIRTIEGFENAEVMRSAYAIEYDAIDPRDIYPTLQSKKNPGLFTAGQINGTSGYEEAAAQGIVAGINAAEYIEGKPMLTLTRADGYIGVLIDDIVTKGAPEPYRIMTSRVEYRLLLRQDNADERLMPFGHAHGLISDERYEKMLAKVEAVRREKERLKATTVREGQALESLIAETDCGQVRPGTSLYSLLKRPRVSYESLARLDENRNLTDKAVIKQVEIQIKYEDYIKLQEEQIERFRKTEGKTIPEDFDYNSSKNLRLEARQKLDRYRPLNLGQASRISGVSPADINVLMIELAKAER
ncbi:MAG: tRNA uridine-5-carboxymethylaminomethyl(34) synthesis enzyme MnmG [Eubacteriaceae bacterium]|nr:tRNA uridine-5-carboxymethylaminomethyl(34) synthesis enzyme MnmG [Eubacteriaceae bacterium]